MSKDKTIIYIDSELKKVIKIAAVNAEMPMTELISNCLKFCVGHGLNLIPKTKPPG